MLKGNIILVGFLGCSRSSYIYLRRLANTRSADCNTWSSVWCNVHVMASFMCIPCVKATHNSQITYFEVDLFYVGSHWQPSDKLMLHIA